ncbi:MAG: hypothetical protein FJ137_03755 [Deltaproteobacteria bacterium]|nr:hypothetical protein [Deltaproteobacteria bacterium]
MSSLVACPRHGLVSVAVDAPCPCCGVAAYDLASRDARAVVRPARELGLQTRRRVVAVVGVVVALTVGGGVGFGPGGLTFDLGAWLGAALWAVFAARPVAVALERDRGLRALDAALAQHKD